MRDPLTATNVPESSCGAIPPALNCDDPDPRCRLDLVRGVSRATENMTFVNTNITRYGQAAALAVRAYPLAG